MTSHTDDAKSPSPAKPLWKRRKFQLLTAAVAGLVLLLLLFVLLLPTLLSTAPGRNLIVSQINNAFLGRVQIDRISLGWFSGAEVDGVQLFDTQNRLAFTAKSLRTQLTLAQAIRGRLELGEVLLDSPNIVLFEVEADGRSNFEKLTKPSDEPLILPPVSANVRITNLTATVQGPSIGAPIRLDPSDLTASIPDLANAPITLDTRLTLRRDGVPGTGTLRLKGSAHAIFAGEIDPNRLAADLDIAADTLPLALAEPFLKDAGITLAGLLGLELKLTAAGLNTASAAGQLNLTNLDLAGPALKGDRLTTPRIAVPLALRITAAPDGTRLLTLERLAVESDLLNLALTANASETALGNLASLRPPGSPGQLTLELRIPSVPALASALPNLLALDPAVSLTSGSAATTLAATWDAAALTTKANLDLTDIAGTNAGKSVRLEPVRLAADANLALAPAGGIADLNVRTADFASGFGTASAAGSLSDLTYRLDLDLARLRQQASQFVDLAVAELAGQLTASGSLKGDVRDPAAPLIATNRTEWTAVRFAPLNDDGSPGPTIDIDRLAADSETALLPAGDARFARAEVRSLRLVAGPDTQPLVLLEANATANLLTSDVPAFDLRRFDVNSLPEVQRRYGALLPALADLSLTLPTGVIRASAAGSFVAGKLDTTRPLDLRLADISLLRDGRRVLWRDSLQLRTALSLQTGITTTARLSGLQLTSASNLISLRQLGDQLEVRLTDTGEAAGNGELQFAADLAALANAAAAWTGNTPDPKNQLRTGRAEGRLALSAPESGPASASLTANLAALTVGDLVRDEAVRISLATTSADDFKTADLTADIASAIVNLEIRDARLVTSAENAFDLLPNATLTLRTDDLAKLDALLAALSPSPNPDSLRITRGALAARLRVARQAQTTQVDLTELRADNLELRRGAAAYRVPEPLNLAGQVRLTTNPAAEIDQLLVPALEGSLGVARLKVLQPLQLTGLSGTTPAYAGAVELAGRLQTVLGLVEVLQGETPGSRYPYTGDFLLSQQLATQGNTTTATGTLILRQLQLLDANGRPNFTEDRLEVANDLTYVAAEGGGDEIRLRQLAVSSASTQALSVRAAGSLRDLANTRTITDPLRIDLGYDLEKLVPLILPFLDDDTRASLQGIEIVGKHERRFEVLGSYPSSSAANVAVRSLGMTGGLRIDRLTLPTYGVVLTNFDPRLALREGILVITLPEPAGLNDGRLNLTGVSVDLNPETPRLSVPKGQVLVEGVALNRVVADKLGRYFGPLFVNTDRASGKLRIRSEGIDKLPLGDLLTATTPINDGRAELTVNIESLELVGGFAGDLIRNMPVLGSFFVGNVPDAKFTIARGLVSHDLPIIVGTQVTGEMRFTGNIELAEPQRLNPLQVRIGSNLLRDRIPLVRDVARLADPVFVIRGTVRQPRMDFAAGIQQWIRDQAGGILPGLLGR